MKEKHIVNEIRKRTLLTILTGRILEITIGTLVISFLLLDNLEQSLIIAVLSEGLCIITSYINDRIWNKFQWGRKVEHEAKK